MAKKRKKPGAWAERCRALRAKRSWQIKDAAAACGVSARTWYYYELGKNDPPRPVQLLIDHHENDRL